MDSIPSKVGCRCETVKDILFLLRHRDCFYLTFVLSIPITPFVPTVGSILCYYQGDLYLNLPVYSVSASQLFPLSPAESEWLSQVSSVRHPQPLHFPSGSQSVQSLAFPLSSSVPIRSGASLHCRPSLPASDRFSPSHSAHVVLPLFADTKIIGADCRLLSGAGTGSILSSLPWCHPSPSRGFHSQSSRLVPSDSFRGCRVFSPPHCLFSDVSRI